MAWKCSSLVNLSSGESEDPDYEDVQCSQLPNIDSDTPFPSSDNEIQSDISMMFVCCPMLFNIHFLHFILKSF